MDNPKEERERLITAIKKLQAQVKRQKDEILYLKSFDIQHVHNLKEELIAKRKHIQRLEECSARDYQEIMELQEKFDAAVSENLQLLSCWTRNLALLICHIRAHTGVRLRR